MTIDDFSKYLIEKTVTELSEKSKCNHSGAGSACPLHGDADCNSSKQNRKEELMPDELIGTTYEVTMEDGETLIIEKEKGLDGKACWKGYKYAGTKMKGGKKVDDCVKAGFEPEGDVIEEKKDMPGSQEKIDANKNGKVDAHDFALLRAKKGKKSVKEMKEIAEASKKKVEIEIMPTVDTPSDPEPPTGKKAEKKKMKEEKEGADKKAENKFHTKLDKLVHKTFGHSSDEKKKDMKKEEVEPLEEKKLSKAEAEKKEKFVKGMKKKFGSMKSKYGEKAKSVMYGAATNMAKSKA
jgi:hypothetical protein